MHKLSSYLTLVAAMIVLTTVGCKKPSTSVPPEQDLLVSIDAGSYTIVTSPSFAFQVKVESAMPVGGVRIETKVVSEIDNQNYPQGAPINTYDPKSIVTIGGLPQQKICICTIKVTSLSKSTNTVTTGFRIGYK